MSLTSLVPVPLVLYQALSQPVSKVRLLPGVHHEEVAWYRTPKGIVCWLETGLYLPVLWCAERMGLWRGEGRGARGDRRGGKDWKERR